jgi:DNA-binding SARP family transcriptional activator/tetratricopeptide (TPR) repeat protein
MPSGAEGTLVEFRVLGPVAIVDDQSRHVEIGGRKEQCALAKLVLAAGKPVSPERLGECVWGDELPPKAKETLQAYVSRLRKRLRDSGLDPSMLASSSQGYRLAAPPGSIDAQRFDRLVKHAEAVADDEPRDAVRLLQEAAALFDGEPLAGLVGEWAHATRVSLQERQRAAQLARVEIELRLGRPDRLIGELVELNSRGPLDQTAVSLLMTALHAAGRTAEALATYQDARVRLRRSIGFEPRRELRELHQQILEGEPVSLPERASARAASLERQSRPGPPDTLGAEPREFVGREADVSALIARADADLRGRAAVCVLAVDGMAGVGKTTLALVAAHRLGERCPGGRLQLGLRGHDPRQPPMEPTEALVTLLGMIGIRGPELGSLTAQDELAALWRSRTAERSLLLLLDDARDAEQIRPLIPTAPGSIVLVTSRARMTGLSTGFSRSLEPLPPSEAAVLLGLRAGTERIDEPNRAEEIARHCGGLPLAVVVAAGHLRSRPAWRLRDLAERMAYARSRPDEGDQLGQPVNAAFALSYRALTPRQRKLFRDLGLHQGPEIGLHAAAALHDAPAADTDRSLDALVGHHLLEEPERRRYRMHDLIRDYAVQRAHYEDDRESRERAVRRLLDFYLFTADQAERTIQPHRRRTPAVVHFMPRDIPPIGTPALAQAWLETEHANLLSAVRYSSEHGFRRHAAQLPHVLAQHLDRQSHWKAAVDAHETALGACYALGNRPGQATALTDLACAHWRTGDLDAALMCAQTALQYWREVGDRAGESDARFELGRIHWHARRPDRAAADLREACVLRARADDSRGHAVATYHLAIVVFELGRHTEGVALTMNALKTARGIRDQTTALDCLSNLGVMYEKLERYREARRCYRQAIELAHEHGSPHRLAVLANNIGEIYARIGDRTAALDSFRAALETYERIGDQRGEIDTLTNAADVYRELTRPAEALRQLNRAAALAERIGDPLLRARVEHTFGAFFTERRAYVEALRAYRGALAQALRAAAPLDQARAHERIGDTLATMSRLTEARVQWDSALELFEQLEVPEADRLRQRLRDLDATA